MSKRLKSLILICFIILIGLAIYFLIFFVKNFGSGSADYIYKIAGFCRLVRTSAHQISVGCENVKSGVVPKVISVGWNENFLVAKSHPLHNFDFESGYQIPDESITYWWIIDLKTKKAYGPLNSEGEFNKQKLDLGVGHIELWSVDQARAKGILLNGAFNN